MTASTPRRFASHRGLVLSCAVMAIAPLQCKKDKPQQEQAAEKPKPAPSAQVPSVGPCPEKFSALPKAKGAAPGKSFTCKCARGELTGSVWGSGIYTTDSQICTAAVHAGAITASGGTVKMKTAQGCPGYVGSAAKGVTSKDKGSHQASYYFEGQGDGKCAEVPCLPSFKLIPDYRKGRSVTCTCSPSEAVGSVWGIAIYTADSSICGAAVHTGVIPTTGGRVRVKGAPGCSKYLGDTRNGIESSKRDAYPASFYFPGKDDGKCPQ